jgi:hypothetical protein
MSAGRRAARFSLRAALALPTLVGFVWSLAWIAGAGLAALLGSAARTPRGSETGLAGLPSRARLSVSRLARPLQPYRTMSINGSALRR